MTAEEIVAKIKDILDGGEADDPYTADAGRLEKIATLVGADWKAER